MLTKDKLEFVTKSALEVDGNLVVYNHPNRRLVRLMRFVEGPPGEDREVDEDESKIVQAPIMADYIRQKLEDIGIHDNQYQVVINEKPDKKKFSNSTQKRLWVIDWEFPVPKVMCDDKTLERIAMLLTSGRWRMAMFTASGKSYGEGCRLAKSPIYQPGQKVRIVGREPDPYSNCYWFMSSGRKGGMGRYILLRYRDGKVVSTSAQLALWEPTNEKE